jgi:hypothetical protein
MHVDHPTDCVAISETRREELVREGIRLDPGITTPPSWVEHARLVHRIKASVPLIERT